MRFSEYLDDENFVDWIAHPTEEKNAYWETYIAENPDEKEAIGLLKEYLSYLQSKHERLTDEEKKEILYQINERIAVNQKPKPVIHLNWFRYAAIAIPLIGLGIFFAIDKSDSNLESNSIESLLNVSLDSVSTTKLVLSDKSEISIEEKKSEINFGQSDDLVINQKDTLAIAKTSANNNGEIVLNQLIVPYGKRSKLTLSDGTLVHINSGSRLIFPSNFIGGQREVYLSGEAYFEVKSDAQRPFTVSILKDDEFSITATGTKFNVNSYDKNDKVTTVLTEGAVHLTRKSKGSLFGKEDKTVMKPGELAEWSISQKVIQRKIKVDTETYISWVRGLLIFKGETLLHIVERLENYYNTKIEIAENIDGQFKLTGKLDLNDSLDKTMQNLSVTASAKYVKNNDNGYVITK